MNEKNSALFSFKLACEKTFSGAVSDFFHSGPQISSIPDQIQPFAASSSAPATGRAINQQRQTPDDWRLWRQYQRQ